MGDGQTAATAYWRAPPTGHNCRVQFLATGEWVSSNLFFSAAFLVAGLGIVGIAAWVLRADRINRAAIDSAVEADDGHEVGH